MRVRLPVGECLPDDIYLALPHRDLGLVRADEARHRTARFTYDPVEDGKQQVDAGDLGEGLAVVDSGPGDVDLIVIYETGTAAQAEWVHGTRDAGWTRWSIAASYLLPYICEALSAELQRQDLRVATAESCTGGAIAAAITSIPGASTWFPGGVVAYANEVKVAALGVSPDTLASSGAVSAEVAVQMAEGEATT